MKILNLDVLIAQEIKHDIECGTYKEGEALPSERELAAFFGAQRMTVRAALQILVNEGLIASRERSGYYVAPERMIFHLNKMKSMSDTLKEIVKENSTDILAFELIELNKRQAERMELPIGTRVYLTERVRYANQVPISFEKSYIPREVVPDLTEADLNQTPLYEVLREKYGIRVSRGSNLLRVVYANEQEARLLGIELSRPLLKRSGMFYDTRDRFIEYSETLLEIDKVAIVNNNF